MNDVHFIGIPDQQYKIMVRVAIRK